jgi:hypothetical protein
MRSMVDRGRNRARPTWSPGDHPLPVLCSPHTPLARPRLHREGDFARRPGRFKMARSWTPAHRESLVFSVACAHLGEWTVDRRCRSKGSKGSKVSIRRCLAPSRPDRRCLAPSRPDRTGSGRPIESPIEGVWHLRPATSSVTGSDPVGATHRASGLSAPIEGVWHLRSGHLRSGTFDRLGSTLRESAAQRRLGRSKGFSRRIVSPRSAPTEMHTTGTPATSSTRRT